MLDHPGSSQSFLTRRSTNRNFKHYRTSSATIDYHEFPGRSHYTVGQDGWEEVADYALEWALEHAKRTAA